MHKVEATDHELIERFRAQKDKEALGTLYLRYMELVYGVCMKYLGQPEAAQDAVMDIYELLNRKLPDHEVLNFGAWLYMVSKNHCLQHLRRKNNLLTVSLDDPVMQNHAESHQEDNLFNLDGERDITDQLHDCISRLPDHQGMVVKKFYFEKKSYVEISGETSMSLDQVRSHIQNGRRNLKKCLENKEKLGSGKNI
ncbi:MAG TPA: sigma-70 family RNA polymerase sigma factor [Saprospiraceae bacterium]|nr:sigma-70 family RNA polymerase sigma factor [Saprospiraceae bacterium]